jgi:translation initiation factor 1
MDVCPKCGLPKELCTCSQIVMQEQVVKVSVEKRRYGKPVTLIYGINFEELSKKEISDLVKSLKTKLACGGTYDKKEKQIELQGSHKDAVKELLHKMGFKVEGYIKKEKEEVKEDMLKAEIPEVEEDGNKEH